MKKFNLEFDEDYCAELYILEQDEEILLYLSDSLEVIDELPDIPKSYEKSIMTLVINSDKWYGKAINKISSELDNEKNIKLMCIYILTEPEEQPLIFGLQFRVSSDVEHGRGMKVEADTMNIIDYGLADIAFC
jgi:hypothetical protein